MEVRLFTHGGIVPWEEQDDGDGNERRKNVPRITVVNYFFTNFPPEWNEGNLREVFAEFGEVADVYVARKLSKVGLRFGFARFFRVGNPQVLEKRLNNIRNGSFKLRANVAKFERSFSKFRQGCKKARKMNGNPSGSDEIPSKNLTGWLQDAVVGESIVIHTTSELQLILRHPFDILDCKVNHLGGVGEEVKHTFDLRSDRIDPIVEGGFSSNRGELKVGEKEKLNLKVDVVQQEDPGDDDKDVKPSDPEINGKGDEIICGSPITTGLVGVLLSHNRDGNNNHSDDGFGDVEGTVTEKAPHDVDTLVTRESKAVVTVVSDSQKIRDPVFEEVSTNKQLFSDLKVFKTCDDMDSCTNKAQWNKFTPLYLLMG
ncbi:nucleotide-binding alpha-beta plait domain-containing protein [Tanacetum coccineum]